MTNKQNLIRENLDIAKKRNLKRDTESLHRVAKNNAIRTNYMKGKMDKSQQNSKCRKCGDRYETINHISLGSRFAQKEYKTRHDWVRKVIHWELCLKFKFNPTNKRYIYNPESVLENEMHKLLWEFEIKTDHPISARRPDLVIVKNKKRKKENLPNSGLCRSGWPQNKTERKAKREIST